MVMMQVSMQPTGFYRKLETDVLTLPEGKDPDEYIMILAKDSFNM